MPKIEPSVEKSLNDHIALRTKDEAIFQSIRSYLMTAGLTKFSKYFKKIAEQEICIKDKISAFILEHSGSLDVQEVPAAASQKGKNIVDTCKKCVGTYKDLVVSEGASVNTIYMGALEAEDITTCKWLEDIVMEQLKMEADATELFAEINFTKTEMDVWFIDQHLTY